MNNTARGAFALSSNVGGLNPDDGSYNNAVGVGFYALGANTTGNFNTAIGVEALGNNTSGSGSVALDWKRIFTFGSRSSFFMLITVQPPFLASS